MKELKHFDKPEHETWTILYTAQTDARKNSIIPEFSDGLIGLDIYPDRIPTLSDVNRKLKARSGFYVTAVDGYEETDAFFTRLARREFPVGNFIRDRNDLNYTPAPDVFHDLYGHVPFLWWPEYANFCAEFGKLALRYKNNPTAMRQCDRFFWFTIEFGLINYKNQLKIFGAGIASSIAECVYALSNEPTVHKFDIDKVSQHEFRIDTMQKNLFVLESSQQLFSSLPDFENRLLST